ncbi:two-component system response regulator RssB [Candidatus Fukatsuia symbiotica]|uniref:Regulator of RpoS n=1 Tax=Candidatus Fukatsuia symbiotica TaxID=1878942 RepID=A0A2U8I584_9GAMM|nr:two-component system response regulator RssB [Candidatus Fukatsuia symbiotica]AWK13355.1 two-component system response regulator RssB [Candidatus Fukatsuia symbiotica]MEA9444239.1 two-component system response regulator RssB [Candidatus Fukatsuia symbiotica]
MEKPLINKKILIVEDEIVFRSVLAGYLSSLGASIYQAVNGREALRVLDEHALDLILCDLTMSEMGGIEFVECLLAQGIKIPVLIISATDKMTDIAQVLRLGVKDVLLKPIVDLARLREAVLACLYSDLFTSPALERRELDQDWDELRKDPQKAAQLLLQLQPPLQQTMAQCKIRYRQLTAVEQPGLVLDIAALSNNELAFYCLDITKAGNNGVLAALLLRVLFNGVLQEHLAQQKRRLPQMTALLQQLNQLLRRTHLDGQFPLLLGYYHSEYKNLSLISAGLQASINIGKNKIQLDNGMPLGTLNTAYLKQISQDCASWECQVRGGGSGLRLTLSTL